MAQNNGFTVSLSLICFTWHMFHGKHADLHIIQCAPCERMELMESGHKKRIGSLGEAAVSGHLKRKGFAIIDQNYLKKWGEIDIIAIKDGRVHFIEVKTVSREIRPDLATKVPHGTSHRAEDNVHYRKLQRLHRAIQSWLLEEGFEGEWQVDVAAVSIDLMNRRATVRMIENVILE